MPTRPSGWAGCRTRAVDALRAVGMFRAVTPHQYGGLEVDPAAFFEAACRVASRCASTGWFASLIGIHNWQLAHLAKEAQDEYFAPGPDTLASTLVLPYRAGGVGLRRLSAVRTMGLQHGR